MTFCCNARQLFRTGGLICRDGRAFVWTRSGGRGSGGRGPGKRMGDDAPRARRKATAKAWTAEALGLDKMSAKKPDLVEEEWVDLWPVSRPYDHHLVQLPIRMGRPILAGEPPDSAEGNAELMKIPNFLHLTPPHIEMHAKALKPLLKPWPKDFDPKTRILRLRTNNHVFPSASVRHPRSREVQVVVNVDSLPALDERGRKKIMSMAGRRRASHKAKGKALRLTCKECPTREQNKDYAMFQLLALWSEAQKKEAWEVEAEQENFPVYHL